MTDFQNRLRDIVSKNLPSWNLGGRQIVSGPIFSDSSYKNRLANFSALEDQFWPKFATFSTRGVKIGQNWRQKLFVPDFIRFAWNSFLRSKAMSATCFKLIFDEKINLGNFRPFLWLSVLKVQNFGQNWSSRAGKWSKLNMIINLIHLKPYEN